MPRLARLDAPGILHHVMGRGIERKEIFYSDTDRSNFVDRLTAIAEEGSAVRELCYSGADEPILESLFNDGRIIEVPEKVFM